MRTKFFRGLVAASALWLTAAIDPAIAQSPAAPVVAAAPSPQNGNHDLVLVFAGLGVVVFLAGRRAR